MDFNMQAVVWLGILVVLLLVETVTMGLTTIWFAGGALIAFILAVCGADLLVQIITFCAVSVLLLIFVRSAAVQWLNKGRIKTNAESLVGLTAVVTEPIDNMADTGRAQVKGQSWMARTAREDLMIPQGKQVKIIEISGAKLIVEEV